MSTARCSRSSRRRAQALGGQVFDVLGKLQFEGKPLRDLLIEAIRYGDQPEVRARLTTVVEHARRPRPAPGPARGPRAGPRRDGRQPRRSASARTWSAPTPAASSRTTSSRSSSKRSSASAAPSKQREPRRYEITHVPAPVRNRDRLIGIGEPVLPRYERIAFEKALIAPQGQPLAAFVCPGHPLLDATHRPDPRAPPRPAEARHVLVDERDPGTSPRVLFYLEHAIQDASLTPLRRAPRHLASGCSTSSSTPTATTRHLHYAPYLDYRPLADGRARRRRAPRRGPSAPGSPASWSSKAQGYAIAHVVPEHLAEVRDRAAGAGSPRPRRRSRTG